MMSEHIWLLRQARWLRWAERWMPFVWLVVQLAALGALILVGAAAWERVLLALAALQLPSQVRLTWKNMRSDERGDRR